MLKEKVPSPPVMHEAIGIIKPVLSGGKMKLGAMYFRVKTHGRYVRSYWLSQPALIIDQRKVSKFVCVKAITHFCFGWIRFVRSL